MTTLTFTTFINVPGFRSSGDNPMINHPNRSKSDTHEVQFTAGSTTVDAEYRQMSKSGHLSVWIDSVQVVDLGWIDYQPDFMTDAGLERFARSEIAQVAEFNRDLSNFGDDESPSVEMEALFKRAGF